MTDMGAGNVVCRGRYSPCFGGVDVFGRGRHSVDVGTNLGTTMVWIVVVEW